MNWLITDKGDGWALRLVDGRRCMPKVLAALGVEALDIPEHYSRQQPGTRSFTRNGQNLVLIAPDRLSTWVSFRPTPGKAERQDGRDAWECAVFRNENALRAPGGHLLSSSLIQEAVLLTCAIWGPLPIDGFITFVKPERVASRNPGYCYKMAGWVYDRPSSDGKPCLRAPEPSVIPSWREWRWHGDRGGELREFLETGRRPMRPLPRHLRPLRQAELPLWRAA